MWVYRRRRRLVLGDALVTTNKGESIVFGADGDADADASRVAGQARGVIQTHALASPWARRTDDRRRLGPTPRVRPR